MHNALFFLVKTFSDLYLLTFLLRFILQWVRADFYNPLSQFLFRVTNPLVLLARRIVPSARSVDLPTLVVLFALELLVTWLLLFIGGFSVSVPLFLQFVALRLINLTLWFYSVSILVYVILSWVAHGYSPMSLILSQLNEPLLRPVRRLLPPIGGLDLSPLLVLILIQAAAMALPLPNFLR
jgi:YggT family protein